MKQLVLLAVLFILSSQLGAQTKLDSLLMVWEDKSNADSTRAWAFADYISAGNFNTNPDSAIALVNQLYKFTLDADFKTGMVDALNLAGYTYFRTGDYPKALDAYQRGLDLSEKIDYKTGTAEISLRIGYIYHDNGDIVKALDYYERSLKIFKEIEYFSGMRSVYNEYGSIYLIKGEYELSLDYYQKALAIGGELNKEIDQSAIYLNIGVLYLEQGDLVEALNNFQKGLSLYEMTGDQLGIASGLTDIGEVYSAQDNKGKALEYFQRSLAISEQINDVQGIADILLRIGEIYADQGEYSRAIENCGKSLLLSKKLSDVDHQNVSCECLYKAHKASGNMEEAVRYLEEMLLFTDSLNSEGTVKKLQQMEFSKQVLQDSIANAEKERLVEAEHQNEILQKEKARNISFGIGLLILILAGGLYSRLQHIRRSKAILQVEKDRSENLLLNILPAEIAQELKEKGKAEARDFEMVSILFSDFKGFTEQSAKLSAADLVNELNHCFKAFDGIMEKFQIEKIKTIGDAYMAAGGLPVPTPDSTVNTALAALEMQTFITNRKIEMQHKGLPAFSMRVGIHTGPVVAGIVGVKKFQYDIWGDTVNTASRIESSSEAGKVNISEATYGLLKEDSRFVFENRGKIHVKGKGDINMYFINRGAN